MNSQTKSKSGFTIIEVVLVLAIAALIFLIVFLAVPALQRSQRDTQRRSDLGRLVAGIQSYQSNNRGELPKDLGGPATGANIAGTNYLGTFSDPSGSDYTFASSTDPTADPATPTSSKINYVKSKDCSGAAKGARVVAVVIGLEGGGVYCQTN